MQQILILSKRQYTNKDLIDDRFGRLREIPLELARMGHTVSGLCLSYATKPEGCFKDETVRWDSLNATFVKLPGLLKFIHKANKMAAKADVILACSDTIYGIIGFVIARRHNIPLIFDLYDNYEYFFLGRLPLIKQLYHWSIRNCAAVTCVSKPLARLIATLRTCPNIVVIENAARTDLFKPLNKSACRHSLGLPDKGTFIGTAGSIHLNRGIDTLIEAFYHLKNKITDLHLVLAGKWDRGVTINKDKRIHYLGELPLEHVPLVINSLDVAVVCNLDNEFGRYCFPQKAHEIMACNVPLVTAGVGSMAEFFRNDPQCLFQPRNAESLMRSIVNGLQTNQPVLVKPQTWKDVAKKMASIIQIVSGQKKSSV